MPQKTYLAINSPTLYHVKTGVVNVGPTRYRTNNEYSVRRAQVNDPRVYPANDISSILGDQAIRLDRALTDASNKAYAKFVDKLGPSAQLGAGIAEIGESYDMITRRAISLRKAFTSLRRFDLPAVAKHLALPRDVQRTVERKVSKKHYVASNWLEYWLGWAPMIGDIYNAIDVIESDIPNIRIKVASSRSASGSFGSIQREYLGFPPENPYLDRHYRYGTARAKAFAGCYATVRVTNHNLNLARQLGILNPISIAWELVPFSFIANWFVNVDQVLGACTDTFGLDLTDQGRFYVLSGNGSVTHHEVNYPKIELVRANFSWHDAKRYPGRILAPTLTARLPDRLSLSRAATSISLLTSIFLKP